MRLSISDFESYSTVCNGTPLLVGFNEVNSVADKIVHSPLSAQFPDFKGGSTYDEASSFFANRFRSAKKHKNCVIQVRHCNARSQASVRKLLMEMHLSILYREPERAKKERKREKKRRKGNKLLGDDEDMEKHLEEATDDLVIAKDASLHATAHEEQIEEENDILKTMESIGIAI